MPSFKAISATPYDFTSSLASFASLMAFPDVSPPTFAGENDFQQTPPT